MLAMVELEPLEGSMLGCSSHLRREHGGHGMATPSPNQKGVNFDWQ